ncbi:hypothetical protein SALB_08201 [Streptomyces noursei]|uniref:Uncharacterized protein n=1 Tax=Streptomyces noursei TaxID=1971 RepID=A0A401RCQ5_STRNR|nr:hypothetical protein SALB_08201 [Streptomyces noursei]
MPAVRVVDEHCAGHGRFPAGRALRTAAGGRTQRTAGPARRPWLRFATLLEEAG